MKKTLTSALILLAFMLSLNSVKAQDTTQCHAFFVPTVNGLSVNFTNVSFAGPSDITAWSWNFGDNGTSTAQNPTHEYTAPGSYTVTLDISGDNCSSTYSTELIVNDCNCTSDYAPVCVATPNGEFIEFTNECYAICEGFTPNNFVDCDTDSTYACEAFFGYENDPNNILAINFMDFSWTVNPVTSWAWDFGDGTTSTEQNPSHTYSENGLYNTTLTITSEGCTNTMAMEVWIGDVTDCNCDYIFNPVCVTVGNEELTFINACEAECYGFSNYFICDSIDTECEVFFGYYQQNFNSLEVQFEDYSYSSTPITSWTWDFGDGTTSTEQNPTHTFAQAGEHQVSLSIVSDNCGAAISETVYVGDFEFPECQAFFWPMQDSTTELSYAFLDFSFGATSWAWDFGDGSTSTEQYPVHSFANTGTYDVVLTITGDNCESTFDLVLDTEDDLFFNVANPADASGAQALYTPVFGEDDNTVYFNNQSASASPITNVEYNFGDGKVSSATDVSHIFPAKKAYNVGMKITNEAGDVSSFSGTIDLSSNTFVSTTGSSSIVLANPTIQVDGFGLVLTPNPVVNELNIDFNLPTTGGYNVEIQSITGQSLFSQSYQNISGQNHLAIDVADYAQGLYLVKLQVNDAYKTFKFVKK